MKMMIAKYPGRCAACGDLIQRGESIYWSKQEGAKHADCIEQDDDSDGGFEPGTLASDRRLARSGISVVRLSSGHVFTQNSRGRCEDAPCCGCCT